MPQKTRGVMPLGIHESQIYGRLGARSIQTYERAQVSDQPAIDALSDVAARPTGPRAQAVMAMYRSLRHQIVDHDLAFRWEIDDAQTFAANQSTPLRTTNENIHGDGAAFNNPIWTFKPSPHRSGAYLVHAMVNYFSGLAQNCQHARLEVWVRRKGIWSRWSVLDVAYANTGAPNQFDYLARICLTGLDIVWLGCNDTMQFRVYNAMAGPLTIAADSIYGYCGGLWLGCPPSATDIDVQPYLLPEG